MVHFSLLIVAILTPVTGPGPRGPLTHEDGQVGLGACGWVLPAAEGIY